VSAVTHAFFDRRWPVRWLLEHIGSKGFAELKAAGMDGMYLSDQALHQSCGGRRPRTPSRPPGVGKATAVRRAQPGAAVGSGRSTLWFRAVTSEGSAAHDQATSVPGPAHSRYTPRGPLFLFRVGSRREPVTAGATTVLTR